MEQDTDEAARLLRELRVELAAQRLITRAIVAFLFFRRDAPLPALVKALSEANDRMSKVPIADLDPQLHAEAAALVKRRSDQLLADLGPLMTATEPRERRSGSPARLPQ